MRSPFRLASPRLALAAALLAATSLSAAAPERAASVAAQPPAVTLPPLAITARTLANGLRVYALPDRTGTTVSVQMWYDVGSKDDPRGKSGFAHLFEHLMFKATRNMPSEMLDRLTEDVGGANNASTADDYTEYHETAPANHLESLIWAEGERLGGLVIDQPSFVSEREVVKEEYRTGLTRPYGQLFGHDLPQANYLVHPYARPGIGNIAELDAASIADVRAFHATYYRPDNAVLVVAGNFDPAKLNGWIDRYLAPIRRPDRPIPRVTVAEPARTGARSFAVTAANTPLPAVVLSWPLPPTTDADHAVVSVIDGLLSSGESSRLYRALVYRDRVASQVGIDAEFKKGPGLFTAYAILAGGRTPADGEAALRREIALLRDKGPGDAELARVKNLLVTAALRQRETAEGRASLVGQSVTMDGDPNAADALFARIQAVTAADVRRVAARLLPDTTAVTIRYQAPVGTQAPADPVHLAASVVTAPLVTPPGVTVVTALPADQRMPPPAPGPVVVPTVPVAAERRLANGLSLVVMERHDLPIVSAVLVARRGSTVDPDDRLGLASLVADLLTRGTTTRSATEVANAIETLGASIDASVSPDGATIGLAARSDQLAPAMALFADTVRRPAFAPQEVERARDEAIDGYQVAIKTPGQLARLVAQRAAYGGLPYGKPADGTAATLKAITRADVARSYAATWGPAGTTLVVAGDVTMDGVAALAERLFGDWTGPADVGTPPPPVFTAPPAPRTIAVDLPGAPQAAVVIARPTLRRVDPVYYHLSFANSVLGGGFSSRLNLEVRIRRGLSYGAGSGLRAGRMPGPFAAAAQTKTESAADVVAVMRAEMRRLGTELVPAPEMAARKAGMIGKFGDAIETVDGLAGSAASLVIERLPIDTLAGYPAAIAAITPEQVRAAAHAYLDPDAASVVVVGDAHAVAPALKAKGLAVETIPAAAIDPALPELVRR